jgi:hypothetical protein
MELLNAIRNVTYMPVYLDLCMNLNTFLIKHQFQFQLITLCDTLIIFEMHWLQLHVVQRQPDISEECITSILWVDPEDGDNVFLQNTQHYNPQDCTLHSQ